MKVLNLLVTGNPGGIETLCKNISFNKSSINNRWMFIFSGGIVADEMKKNSKDEVIVLNEKKNFFKIIKAITTYCKKNNVDVITIHHGGTYTNLIYIFLRLINKKIKFVRYLHSCFDTELVKKSKINTKIYKHLLQKSINISDLVICVSNSVKDTHVKNLKLKNKNIKVVYNGINEHFFKDIGRDFVDYGAKNLIYVGRLEKEKGLDILIDALPIVKSEIKDVNLLIVGDGSEMNNLKEKTISNELSDNVKFIGKQLNITEYLDKSDIFVHPTRCDEAFGISVVEAMSRGIVPITFEKGGLPEIIESGLNGYMVREISKEALAQKIIEVLNSDLTQVRKNAIETSKQYTIKNTIEQIEKEYDSLFI